MSFEEQHYLIDATDTEADFDLDEIDDGRGQGEEETENEGLSSAHEYDIDGYSEKGEREGLREIEKIAILDEESEIDWGERNKRNDYLCPIVSLVFFLVVVGLGVGIANPFWRKMPIPTINNSL